MSRAATLLPALLVLALSPPTAGAQRFTGVIWDGSITTQTPLGVALSDPGDRILSAAGYQPATAALFDAQGDAAPLWRYPIQPQTVDAQFSMSADGATRVLVYSDLTNSRSGVYKWTGDSSEPDWQFEFPQGALFARGEVSADGSRIVAGAASAVNVYLAVFDPVSADPLWMTSEPTWVASFEALSVSGDGRTAVANDMGRVWAFDTADGAVLWEDIGTLSLGCDLSWDGRYLAAAAGAFPTQVQVLERNGAAYDLLWSFRMPGAPDAFYDAVGLSDDGLTLAIGATDASRRGHNWLGVFDTKGSDPLWSREIAGGPGGGWFIWDVLEHIDVAADGSRIAAGYWGDPQYPHAECVVFERANPDPILVLDTPGSVFGLDLRADGSQLALACKRIHASQPGYGGSVYSIDLSTGLELEVVASPTQPVAPGSVFDLELRLTNGGSAAQSYDELELLVADPAPLEHDLYAGSPLTLAPGASDQSAYQVQVPPNAPSGRFSVEAVARLTGGWLDRAEFVLEVE